MKKVIKRILAVLLAVSILTAACPTAFAADSCFSPCDKNCMSIVDALNSIGEDASYNARCDIAQVNNISDYHGSAEQNMYMLQLLKEGNLKRPGYVASEETTVVRSAVFVGAAKPGKPMIEVTANCIVRAEPTKNSDEVCHVEVGDSFEVKDTITNKYGNVWFQISCLGTDAYIYQGNVGDHIHNYILIDGTDISLCQCGAYLSASAGAMTIDAMAYAPNIFADAEALGAAASVLGAAGSTIAGAVSAAIPPAAVVAVVVVAGVLIYLAVSQSGAKVYTETAELIETDVQLRGKLSRDGFDGYYKAATLDGCGLLLAKDSMGLEEANDFLKVATFSANRTVSELSGSLVASVYTLSQDNARMLADRFAANGPAYGYGNSKGANEYAEPSHKVCYFDHFHTFYAFNGTKLSKVWGSHIFFGLPKPMQVL